MEEKMFIYPNEYLNRVEDINIEFLQRNKIKALILDIDNTLIDYNKNLSDNVIKWAKELKGQGVKLYLLSNTNHKEKVEKVANSLSIPYSYLAKKPFKSGSVFIGGVFWNPFHGPSYVAFACDSGYIACCGFNYCFRLFLCDGIFPDGRIGWKFE